MILAYFFTFFSKHRKFGKKVKEREDDKIENACFGTKYIQISNYIYVEHFAISWILTKIWKLIDLKSKNIICHDKVNLKETNDFNMIFLSFARANFDYYNLSAELLFEIPLIKAKELEARTLPKGTRKNYMFTTKGRCWQYCCWRWQCLSHHCFRY